MDKAWTSAKHLPTPCPHSPPSRPPPHRFNNNDSSQRQLHRHRNLPGLFRHPRQSVDGIVRSNTVRFQRNKVTNNTSLIQHIAGPEVAWGLVVRRGRRAGHVRKGRPGTWEISSSPPMRGGAGAAVEVVQAHGEVVRPRGSEGGRSGGSAERRKRSEARGEARSRSRLIGTDEVGELTPEDPAEGKRPTG